MLLRRARLTPPPNVVKWNLDDISFAFKCWCWVGIALPKLTIALLIGHFGGSYIMESSDRETMLLKTLSVVFVLEIDEILYEAFTSDYMKDSLVNMKAVEYEVGNQTRYMVWALNAVLYPLLVIGACAFTVFSVKKASGCEVFENPFAAGIHPGQWFPNLYKS